MLRVHRNTFLWTYIVLRLVLPVATMVVGGVVYPKVERIALKAAIIVCVAGALRDAYGLWERRPRLWRRP